MLSWISGPISSLLKRNMGPEDEEIVGRPKFLPEVASNLLILGTPLPWETSHVGLENSFSITCCFHRLKRCPKVRSTDACGQIDPLFWTSSFSSKRIRSSLEEGTRRMSSETRERIVSDDSCLVPSFFSKEKRKRKHNRSKIKIDCVMFLPDAPLNGRLEETSHRLSGRWQSFPLLND